MTHEELQKALAEYRETFHHESPIFEFTPGFLGEVPENCYPAELYISANIRRENVAVLIKLLQEFEQSLPAPRASLETNSTASDRCELLPAAD